jgi:MFS family permease
LRWLFIFMAATGFLGITTEVLLTPYLLSFTSSANLGLVMAASGAGLLAGGLVMSFWGASTRLLYGVLGFELLISLCTIGIGLSRLPWLLAVLVFVYFMAVALSDSCSRTLLMQGVEPAYQGRIFALRDALNLLSLSGGLLLTAPLAEFVLEPLFGDAPGSGIGLVFLVAGIANSLLVLLALAWKPLWQIET